MEGDSETNEPLYTQYSLTFNPNVAFKRDDNAFAKSIIINNNIITLLLIWLVVSLSAFALNIDVTILFYFFFGVFTLLFPLLVSQGVLLFKNGVGAKLSFQGNKRIEGEEAKQMGIYLLIASVIYFSVVTIVLILPFILTDDIYHKWYPIALILHSFG